MEALLLINSLLVGICLYFIKDFHGDFKEVSKTVNHLKEKFAEMSVRVDNRIKAGKKRVSKVSTHQDKKE